MLTLIDNIFKYDLNFEKMYVDSCSEAKISRDGQNSKKSKCWLYVWKSQTFTFDQMTVLPFDQS